MNQIEELTEQTLKLSLAHYEHFLHQDASTTQISALLSPSNPSSLHELIDASTAQSSSLSSSLPSVLASLTSLTASHASTRSSLLSLPPLLTLSSTASLVTSLIHSQQYAAALSLITHVTNLAATTLDAAGNPFQILTALADELRDKEALDSLTNAVILCITNNPDESDTTSSTSNSAQPRHEYVDLIHILEQCYGLRESTTTNHTQVRLQLQFLQCRATYLARVTAPPSHVSRSLPLSPAQIVAIISKYRTTLFSIITNYTTIFPTAPFPLISVVSTNLDAFLGGTVMEYVKALPTLPLNAAREIVESVDFLQSSLQVLNLDLTFDGCVVNDLYGLTIANVVSFGPDFSRTTNNGKFVDDGRVKDWTSPLCLHSVKVILGRRLAALAGRSKQPVGQTTGDSGNVFACTVNEQFPLLARLLGSFVAVVNEYRACIYLPGSEIMSANIETWIGDMTDVFAKFDKETFGKIIKRREGGFDVRAYFRKMKAFWVEFGARYVRDVWGVVLSGGKGETQVEADMRAKMKLEQEQEMVMAKEEGERKRVEAEEARKAQAKAEEEARKAQAKKEEEVKKLKAKKEEEERKLKAKEAEDARRREAEARLEESAAAAELAKKEAEKAGAGGEEAWSDEDFGDDW